MFPPGVAVKKQSTSLRRKIFATRLSCMICRTERPGKFYIVPMVDRLDVPQQLLLRECTNGPVTNPLGWQVLLRCLDDLFSLGLVTNRCSSIARCRMCVIKTCLDNACSPLNMDIPGSVLTAIRSIIRSDCLPITISRSWWAITQLVRVVCTGMQVRFMAQAWCTFSGLLLRHFTDSLRKQTNRRELLGTVDHFSVFLQEHPQKVLDSL